MMDKEIKQRWVTALRSRNYKQTKDGFLKAPGEDTFCCLGVLCDIQGYSWKHRKHGLATSQLPKGYAVGVTVSDAKNLASMNDSNYKFYQIANYIERNL